MNRLLIHACCGPCLSAPLEVLAQSFDGEVTVFFYNPNMDTFEEHERRLDALQRYVKGRYGDRIPVESVPYDPSPFQREVAPLAGTGERGERCTVCYALRLRRAFEEACMRGMSHVATTLTVSPHKDRRRIDRIGVAMEKHFGVSYFTGVWDASRSRELSREYGIYRQDYCGCVASAAERDWRRQRSSRAEREKHE